MVVPFAGVDDESLTFGRSELSGFPTVSFGRPVSDVRVLSDGSALSTVVVVSGLPAAGKSTLARRLSKDLRLPLLSRDDLKKTLFPEYRSSDHAALIDRVIEMMLTTLLEAGVGAVVDGNFNVVEQAAPVRDALAARAVATCEICLWGDADVLRPRFVERADPPLTPDLEPYFERCVTRDRWTVLDPSRALHIDTTDIAAVDERYPEIVRRVVDARPGS